MKLGSLLIRVILSLLLLTITLQDRVNAANDESLLKAQLFFAKGDYDEAIEYFEKAGKQTRFAFKAALGLARVLIEKGKFEEAMLACDRALKLSPSHPEALTVKGDVLKITGRYDPAKSHYSSALEQSPDHLEARLGLGRMQWEWGDKAGARQTFGYFITYYKSRPELDADELNAVAQACIYLDRFRDANNLFYDATKADRKLWQAFIPWGNLFLSKYNVSDAARVFEDALKINPNAAEAQVGLARCYMQENFEKAKSLAKQALAINPNLVEAHNLLAEMDIALGDFESALEKLEVPLQVNPNSTTSRTLRAISFHLSRQDEKFADEEAKILAVNPRYADLYYQLGEVLSRRYLFKESVDYYQQAVALDSEHWAAYAGLGNSLSRLGEEEEAKKTLEKAFAKDPFNKYVGNLLTLFDEFPQYKTHDAGNGLLVRMHERDDPVLSKYAVDLASESFSALSQKYDFDRTTPVLLEIFPEHDDFAVRCFGLPGAQAFLGICFGNVVAMDSPRARPKGDFVWGETLWHELVHVSHLRMTGNRIPRWLAEGIAVYETSTAKPHWSMGLDLPFIQAFLSDKLLPLEKLDSGFNRPTSPGQVSLSYFQASIIVEFLVEKYGHDMITQTFPKFRQGLETAEVLEAVFEKTLKTLDDEFKSYVKEKYSIGSVDYSFDPSEFEVLAKSDVGSIEAELKKKPNDPIINFQAGAYHKNKGDYEKAIPLLQRARELFPNYVLEPSPYKALVEIYLEQDNKPAAVAELKALTSRNGKNVESLTLLANLCAEMNDNGCAIEALEKLLYISPFDSDVHQKLAAAYSAQNRFPDAIKELHVLLNTNPQDLAGAHCDLADAYLRAGQKAEAKASALTALEIAPNYERAQEILLACLE
ncbi:tetratricopeptide repeat protein [bacterium]|nr:tetratricopeptide repeat protein [bacterium]